MTQVAPGVLQIPLMQRAGINCYLIDDVLVDAGISTSHRKILPALKNLRVSAHALTHAHADHQGSSKIVCEQLGIPLWCSEAEKPQAESGNATREYPFQNHIVTRFQRAYWAGPGYPVSRVLREGDEVGGFVVIDTPGHSSGHISFFRERDGVLIAGDLAVNMNLITTRVGLRQPPGLFTLDQVVNVRSILKIAALKPSVICFGHGPVLYNKGTFEAWAASLPAQ